MSADPVLQLRAVTRRFGSVTAVDAVDLEVARGEFLTLLGPSGSGKSTLLMMIAGFEQPDAGDIRIDGRSQIGVPPHRRKIGVVFQSYAVFPHLTVFENVAFALRNLAWPAAEIGPRVAEMLALVRLDGLEQRMPSQLSGGQQQRVALARALAFRPSLLLLDEPLGALDKRLRDHMLAEFRRIHRTLGTTMLFVTHDQEEALAMSDRVAVMDHGRIVQLDRPRAIYARPQSEFVAGFVGDTNLYAGVTQPGGRILLDGGWHVHAAHDLPGGLRIHLVLRPEHVDLGDGANAIDAQVEERLYLGRTTKYVLRTALGLQVQVQVANRLDTPDLEVGDAARISWEPRSGLVLPVREGS